MTANQTLLAVGGIIAAGAAMDGWQQAVVAIGAAIVAIVGYLDKRRVKLAAENLEETKRLAGVAAVLAEIAVETKQEIADLRAEKEARAEELFVRFAALETTRIELAAMVLAERNLAREEVHALRNKLAERRP